MTTLEHPVTASVSTSRSDLEAKPVGLWDHVLGFSFATTYIAILVRTVRTLGYARDEGFYFDAGRSYATWIELLLRAPREALTQRAIDGAWNVNHEHPSLMKSLFGLSWLYLHEKHHWFAEAGTAFRFPGMVMAGAALWLVYIMGARAYSRQAGMIAAACLAFMPRVFYHAHLDAFDVPVMFWWTLVVYCYWRSLENGWGSLVWALATGVAWGFALNVKFNVFPLPAVFLLHFAIVRAREYRTALTRGGSLIPTAVIAMLTIGVATFFALWPWMWSDRMLAPITNKLMATFDLPGVGEGAPRLSEYLGFHWNHPYYNIEYFGFNYFRPPFPFSYPYVMIAFTVPLITLTLAVVGLGTRMKPLLRDLSSLAWFIPPYGRVAPYREFRHARPSDDPTGTDLLFLAAGYAILALWWKRDTPIFGGTKHWFTLYPFLALFAGAGFERISRTLAAHVKDKVHPAWLPTAALASICLLPALAVTAHSHPFGLSSYTPLAGGTAGGADLGMNRQFWGFTTGSLVDFFNREVPEHGTVFIHDTTGQAWEMLQSDGRLRSDIHATWWDISSAEFAIVHHELHMNEVDYQIWQAFQSPAVYYVLSHDGVPIVSVYRRNRRR